MQAGHVTVMITLFLLLSGMTSTASILTTLSKTFFGVEDLGRVKISGSGWDGRKLDRESAVCLSCHDGVIANDSPIEQRPVRARGMGSPSGSHPVGVSYSHVSSKNGKEYVAEMSLNPAIRLVDGMLSCISCHEKKTGADKNAISMAGNVNPLDSCTAGKRTVIDNAGSRLCFACHLK